MSISIEIQMLAPSPEVRLKLLDVLFVESTLKKQMNGEDYNISNGV